MESTKTILPQSWMGTPEALVVMGALGGPEHALFVGGCVRNALLNFAVDDVDIATRWTPPEVAARLEKAGIKALPTGIDHGTITAVVDKKSFEITTLRRDVETSGRRAVVAFTKDWKEDAQRRDFTINTLLADAEGNIYDPLGQGLADLEARRVVFVGDPAVRIAEDYLRILRFFRFYGRYGAGEPDAGALKACREAAGKITHLSRERITQEFLKILMANEPDKILSLMFNNNILKDFFNSGYKPETLGNLDMLQRQYGWPDLAARLVVLAGFDPAHMSSFEKGLVFSGLQKKRLGLLFEACKQESGQISARRARVLVYKHGSPDARQVALLCAARDGQSGLPQDSIEILEKWCSPAFPVNGKDVAALGVPEGPETGRILRALEDWWLAQDFKPGREDCLNRLKKRKEEF